MIRTPTYVFENESSLGIDHIPNGTIILIHNYNGIKNKTITKLTSGGIARPTIQEWIEELGGDGVNNWQEISTPEKGGITWSAGTDYATGDSVYSDSGKNGNGAVYYCTSDHTSVDFLVDESNWSNSSELEKITLNGNTGHRIKGRDTTIFTEIGRGAIDLSDGDGWLAPHGAVGDNSFAVNWSTKASGEFSFASGWEAQSTGWASFCANEGEASGGTSAAFGHGEATEQGAFAINNGKANAKNSFAGGNSSISTGQGSFSFGSGCSAEGIDSIAVGSYTTAINNGALAIGINNVGISADTVFEVGIGVAGSGGVGKNALEVYRSGLILAPEIVTHFINSAPKALVTKEYLDEYIVGSETRGLHNETRIPAMVEMTQIDYDALGAGRPNKMYVIVGVGIYLGDNLVC